MISFLSATRRAETISSALFGWILSTMGSKACLNEVVRSSGLRLERSARVDSETIGLSPE